MRVISVVKLAHRAATTVAVTTTTAAAAAVEEEEKQQEMHPIPTFVDKLTLMQYHPVINVVERVHRENVQVVRVASGMCISVLWKYHERILRLRRRCLRRLCPR